jgi:hypothetical protein
MARDGVLSGRDGRLPEGRGPGPRGAFWSWVLLGSVLLAAVFGLMWAMLAAMKGLLWASAAALVLVLAVLVAKGGPVLAAGLFRRKDVGRGPGAG